MSVVEIICEGCAFKEECPNIPLYCCSMHDNHDPKKAVEFALKIKTE